MASSMPACFAMAEAVRWLSKYYASAEARRWAESEDRVTYERGTMMPAGGGVKRGHSHGETDPIGFGPTTRPVEVRDLHATMLKLLGFDHEKLVYPLRGLDQRLTGVEPARVIDDLIA